MRGSSFSLYVGESEVGQVTTDENGHFSTSIKAEEDQEVSLRFPIDYYNLGVKPILLPSNGSENMVVIAEPRYAFMLINTGGPCYSENEWFRTPNQFADTQGPFMPGDKYAFSIITRNDGICLGFPKNIQLKIGVWDSDNTTFIVEKFIDVVGYYPCIGEDPLTMNICDL